MNGFLLSVAPKAGPCHIGQWAAAPISCTATSDGMAAVFQWGGLSSWAGFPQLSPPWAGFIILATATGLFILRALWSEIIYSPSSREAAFSVGAGTWWRLAPAIDRSRWPA